jgi:hypothetical protein
MANAEPYISYSNIEYIYYYFTFEYSQKGSHTGVQKATFATYHRTKNDNALVSITINI